MSALGDVLDAVGFFIFTSAILTLAMTGLFL